MSIFDEMLSVVVPAYNEGERVYENLVKMNEILGSFSNSFEIIPVNDGSVDNTKQEMERAARECTTIVLTGYDTNRGKGGAIKVGVEKAKGTYIAFLDADLDLTPMHLKDFMETMESRQADVVIGSKLHKDSKVDYPLPRKIMSFGYYLMLKVLFRLNVKDTQTGVKLFKAACLKNVIGQVETFGFAYDIEILALVNQQGAKIVERPIELNFQRGNGWGRIKISDITGVARDTFHVLRKVHSLKKTQEKICG